MSCDCFIIPPDVLERLAKGRDLPEATRQALLDTIELDKLWRKIRQLHTDTVRRSNLLLGVSEIVLAAAPSVTVYDAKHTTTLPGTPVPNPGASKDLTAKRAFDETTAVAQFYKVCFGRNSADNRGMTLMSTIHYGVRYNNAFWNGAQMTYGDGDGNIFLDFTLSNDVIGHELTHGVTQYTAGLGYTNEAGGLNESISDVFGSLFRQWRANQSFAQADWLIGAGIMGPAAKSAGFTCLRDLANPGATHCLSPQPSNYKQYVPGSDPHISSGIPNHAFYLVAKAIGGNAWEKAGKIWYAALTSGKTSKNMTFKAFANLTRSAAKSLYPGDAGVYAAVDGGWKAVGLP